MTPLGHARLAVEAAFVAAQAQTEGSVHSRPPLYLLALVLGAAAAVAALLLWHRCRSAGPLCPPLLAQRQLVLPLDLSAPGFTVDDAKGEPVCSAQVLWPADPRAQGARSEVLVRDPGGQLLLQVRLEHGGPADQRLQICRATGALFAHVDARAEGRFVVRSGGSCRSRAQLLALEGDFGGGTVVGVGPSGTRAFKAGLTPGAGKCFCTVREEADTGLVLGALLAVCLHRRSMGQEASEVSAEGAEESSQQQQGSHQ